MDAVGNGTTIGLSKTDTFTTITASQVRLYVTSTANRGGDSSPSIYEFEVWSQIVPHQSQHFHRFWPVQPRQFGKTTPGSLTYNQSTTVTLTWSSSADATSYAYCYGVTSACTPTTNTGSQTSAVVSGLTPDTTYYWQVQAQNVFGTRDADEAQPFAFATAGSRHANQCRGCSQWRDGHHLVLSTAQNTHLVGPSTESARRSVGLGTGWNDGTPTVARLARGGPLGGRPSDR